MYVYFRCAETGVMEKEEKDNDRIAVPELVEIYLKMLLDPYSSM
jgi:putative ubiquitin-RnfH superfamily antitoxin RatB of RatAB toxin-antitoxin module